VPTRLVGHAQGSCSVVPAILDGKRTIQVHPVSLRQRVGGELSEVFIGLARELDPVAHRRHHPQHEAKQGPSQSRATTTRRKPVLRLVPADRKPKDSIFGWLGQPRQKYGPALFRLAVRSSHVGRPAHSLGPHRAGLWSALMPTEPLTLAALARFHRKVIAPDFERVVGRLDRIEARLGDIDSHFDAIYDRFQRLETEYEIIKAALNRLEGQLGALVETRQKFVLRSDLQELKARVETLQGQIKALEERIGA